MVNNLPIALTDFSQAIQAIRDSQLDVQELVSKWADIIDDTTPKVVNINLTNRQTLPIRNLAMVEAELRESVRETYPNINKSRSSFSGGSATAQFSAIYGATSSHGKGKFSKALSPMVAWTQSAVNDFVTYRPVNPGPAETEHTIVFSQLPRQVMLGYPDVFLGTTTVNNYTRINVTPITSGDTDFDLPHNVDDGQNASGAVGYHYSCTVRFINHSPLNDHTLHLFSGTRTEGSRKILIPKSMGGALNYADVLFFCGKGLDVVNIELLNGGGASYV